MATNAMDSGVDYDAVGNLIVDCGRETIGLSRTIAFHTWFCVVFASLRKAPEQVRVTQCRIILSVNCFSQKKFFNLHTSNAKMQTQILVTQVWPSSVGKFVGVTCWLSRGHFSHFKTSLPVNFRTLMMRTANKPFRHSSGILRLKLHLIENRRMNGSLNACL